MGILPQISGRGNGACPLKVSVQRKREEPHTSANLTVWRRQAYSEPGNSKKKTKTISLKEKHVGRRGKGLKGWLCASGAFTRMITSQLRVRDNHNNCSLPPQPYPFAFAFQVRGWL